MLTDAPITDDCRAGTGSVVRAGSPRWEEARKREARERAALVRRIADLLRVGAAEDDRALFEAGTLATGRPDLVADVNALLDGSDDAEASNDEWTRDDERTTRRSADRPPISAPSRPGGTSGRGRAVLPNARG